MPNRHSKTAPTEAEPDEVDVPPQPVEVPPPESDDDNEMDEGEESEGGAAADPVFDAD